MDPVVTACDTFEALDVTIDEKEYLHLGCLLEELFPEAKIQMVSSIINPKGRATNYFTRTDEYLFYVFFGMHRNSPIKFIIITK